MGAGVRTGSQARSLIGNAAGVVLLAGPTVLAFFAGGYFDEPRAVAGLIAWILVALGVAVCPPAASLLPRGLGARLAIAGLGLLAAWTLLSTVWAPIAGDAYHAGQIAFLYLGALLASLLLLRERSLQRLAEPLLAAGTVIVIGYGLSGRLFPGLLHFARSVSAQGRLEQPLTYWNAMGELAALGLVLGARIAGDATRPRAIRMAAAAACAPLGMGLYITFSRGALFAAAAGLVTLVVVAHTREQITALALCLGAGALAALAAAPLRGVTSLAGGLSTRESQGALALVLLLAIATTTALVRGRMIGRERLGDLRLPRHAGWIAAAAVCGGLAVAIAVGAKETSAAPLSGGATRLVTLQSNRYAYWDVALRAFIAEPVHGVGAGGWSVWWLRYRTVNEYAQDAHSLPLQTLAELGLIGAALLLVFLGGVALAARHALDVAPAAAAGPTAAAVVYLAHAPLDWDWEMPAVTLVAVVLAGLLLAVSEQSRRPGGVALAEVTSRPDTAQALPR